MRFFRLTAVCDWLFGQVKIERPHLMDIKCNTLLPHDVDNKCNIGHYK